MYTLNCFIRYYSNSDKGEDLLHRRAETAESIAEQLIDASDHCPITLIKFADKPRFYARTRDNRGDQWCLDYSKEDLTGMIKEAMPNGGEIKAWHEYYSGGCL
jgi:hypothetical protein